MTHKPAPVYKTPVPQSHTAKRDPAGREPAPRGKLDETPELRFLRDEIEALLGSATVRRTRHAPGIRDADDHAAIAPEDLGKEWLERATESESSGSPESPLEAVPIDEVADLAEVAGFDDRIDERDTEPSLDAQLLREAMRVAGK